MAADDFEPRAIAHEGCKQVTLDGEHFADAASPEDAQIIADCINYAGLPADEWPRDVNERLIRRFQ